MSEGYENDINQGLKKIGAEFSSIDEKQRQIVQMIKRQEVKTRMIVNVNPDIPGLRRRLGNRPTTYRMIHPFSTQERNGVLNVAITGTGRASSSPSSPSSSSSTASRPSSTARSTSSTTRTSSASTSTTSSRKTDPSTPTRPSPESPDSPPI
eukprot:CAMPEP_0168612772 /NCGR_PEP_ID=MMETSP0449_2-20121227/3095_1 /TAXON_ID=1082188 /ORGANISM="Strombidium rassoulzadegani, Strain ras09" /LENGTH=151 /DNA_ID=CAMNT_0008653359 /DNA_START=3 /DNA_END=459 /DNA_ORIENTATION=-